jgi:NitT/TauT family transport system ATP-binding protein
LERVSELIADDVAIRYDSDGARTVLACEGVNFTIGSGEFVAFVGRSGCGKTSMLYAIDGLVPVSSGKISLGGREVTAPGRDRAVVFQSPTLFPWRSILGNVKYGAETVVKKDDLDRQAHDLIDLVGLKGFEGHHPHQLSGGMQQRVNLARALAVDPDVLLLDEPFSALDAQTRDLMQNELLRIWSTRNEGARGLTAVFVTHDIPEAVYLADRVLVFSARPGRVREDVRIDLPRPRNGDIRRAPEFQEYVDRITGLLEGEGR